jgi:hypothetical protein
MSPLSLWLFQQLLLSQQPNKKKKKKKKKKNKKQNKTKQKKKKKKKKKKKNDLTSIRQSETTLNVLSPLCSFSCWLFLQPPPLQA